MRKEEYTCYIETLKHIVDTHYEKEMVFYNDLGWYSRDHGRQITPQEMCDYVKEIANHYNE